MASDKHKDRPSNIETSNPIESYDAASQDPNAIVVSGLGALGLYPAALKRYLRDQQIRRQEQELAEKVPSSEFAYSNIFALFHEDLPHIDNAEELATSVDNFTQLAETVRFGRPTSMARPDFSGFPGREFGGNWSKIDLGTLPKVNVKDIKLDGSFQQSFQVILANEGGFSNHKADRGGATIYGIASNSNPREYEQIMDRLKAGDQQGAMDITMATYKTKYWDAAGVDAIKDPSARLVAFDAAVNHGVGYAKKMIERTNGDAENMLKYRANTFNQIIANDFSQQVFAKGWSNRLAKLDAIADNQQVAASTDFGVKDAVLASQRQNKPLTPTPPMA